MRNLKIVAFISFVVVAICAVGYYSVPEIWNKVLTTGGTAVTGYYTEQEALNLVYNSSETALNVWLDTFDEPVSFTDSFEVDGPTDFDSLVNFWQEVTISDTTRLTVSEIRLGDTEWEAGYKVRYMINKQGATVYKGQWLMADTTFIEVLDSIANDNDPDTFTADENLASEGGINVMWYFPMSIADACSVEATVVDENGAVVVDTTELDTDDDFVACPILVDSVQQIRFLGCDANDSLYIIAFPICPVVFASANCANIVGVVAEDSIEDNTVGKVCVFGLFPWTIIDCSTTDGKPGYHMEGTSAGKADANVSPTGAGTSGGILMQACTDVDTGRVFINPR